MKTCPPRGIAREKGARRSDSRRKTIPGKGCGMKAALAALLSLALFLSSAAGVWSCGGMEALAEDLPAEEEARTAGSLAAALELTMQEAGYEDYSQEEKDACLGELFELDGRKALVLWVELPFSEERDEGSYVSLWVEEDEGALCLFEQQIDLSQAKGMHLGGVSVLAFQGKNYLYISAGVKGYWSYFYYLLEEDCPLAYEFCYQAAEFYSAGGLSMPKEDSEVFTINQEQVDRESYYAQLMEFNRGKWLATLAPEDREVGVPVQGKSLDKLAEILGASPQTAEKASPLSLGYGNLANGGFATGDSQYAYYVTWSGSRFKSLIREDLETRETTSLMSAGLIGGLNLVDGTLYFQAPYALMRVQEGSDFAEKIYSCDKGVFDVTYYDGRLYFGAGTDLVSCDLDGGDLQVLFRGSGYGIPFCIVSDKIYFSDPVEWAHGGLYYGKLSVMDLDGSNKADLSSKHSVLCEYLFSDGEWLYFLGTGNSATGEFLRCRLDGSGLSSLYIYTGPSFNCDGTRIYASLSDGLYRLNDSLSWELVCSGRYDELCIVGDKLYYYESTKLYRSNLDGSLPEALG